MKRKLRKSKSILDASKTVPTPPAHNTTLLHQGSIVDANINRLVHKLSYTPYSNSMIEFIIVLMFRHGLRITETLNIKSSDCRKDGLIKINALKGSQSRLIRNVDCLPQFEMFRTMNVELKYFSSRFTIYRIMKSLNLQNKFGVNKNYSVTHLGRHIYAIDVQTFAKSSEITQRELGHKSKKSTEYYI